MARQKTMVLLLVSILEIVEMDSQAPILQLNSQTFDKIINNAPNSFVQFIQHQSKKDPQNLDPFEVLAQELLHENGIVFAQVLIPGFGRHENHDLAERFGLSDGTLPELVLFSKHATVPGKLEMKETRYGGPLTLEQLRKFLELKTGIWVRLPGCLDEFDELAQLFARNSGKDRRKIMQQTEELIQSYLYSDVTDKANTGQKYLKIMKILLQRSDFVTTESLRIEGLLQSNQLSTTKSQDLQMNLNILKSFQHRRLQQKKDEL